MTTSTHTTLIEPEDCATCGDHVIAGFEVETHREKRFLCEPCWDAHHDHLDTVVHATTH